MSWLLSNESETHKSSGDKTTLFRAIHVATEASTRAVVRRNNMSTHLFVIYSEAEIQLVLILQFEKPLGDGLLLTTLI